jgi:hypothetical protein
LFILLLARNTPENGVILLFFLIKKVNKPVCRQAGKSRQIPLPPFLLKEKVAPKVQADFDAEIALG